MEKQRLFSVLGLYQWILVAIPKTRIMGLQYFSRISGTLQRLDEYETLLVEIMSIRDEQLGQKISGFLIKKSEVQALRHKN